MRTEAHSRFARYTFSFLCLLAVLVLSAEWAVVVNATTAPLTESGSNPVYSVTSLGYSWNHPSKIFRDLLSTSSAYNRTTSTRAEEHTEGSSVKEGHVSASLLSSVDPIFCGQSNAVCPRHAPVCCGDEHQFFCLKGGNKCCGASGMKGHHFCQQSDTCCMAGNNAICCPAGSRCSSVTLLTGEVQASCVTENCSAHTSVDSCLSDPQENCGWCCEEKRCIHLSGTPVVSELPKSEAVDRATTITTTTTTTTIPPTLHNASCRYGQQPLRSLLERCRSKCSYYQTCEHCNSPMAMAGTSRVKRGANEGTHDEDRRDQGATTTTRTMISSTTTATTTWTSERAVSNEEDDEHPEGDEPCVWCLSTMTCMPMQEALECPNDQFIVDQRTCELSWFSPTPSYAEERMAATVGGCLAIMILIAALLVQSYRQGVLKQWLGFGEPEDTAWSRLHRSLQPQEAVRRYGFAFDGRRRRNALPLPPVSPPLTADDMRCVLCGVPCEMAPPPMHEEAVVVEDETSAMMVMAMTGEKEEDASALKRVDNMAAASNSPSESSHHSDDATVALPLAAECDSAASGGEKASRTAGPTGAEDDDGDGDDLVVSERERVANERDHVSSSSHQAAEMESSLPVHARSPSAEAFPRSSPRVVPHSLPLAPVGTREEEEGKARRMAMEAMDSGLSPPSAYSPTEHPTPLPPSLEMERTHTTASRTSGPATAMTNHPNEGGGGSSSATNQILIPEPSSPSNRNANSHDPCGNNLNVDADHTNNPYPQSSSGISDQTSNSAPNNSPQNNNNNRFLPASDGATAANSSTVTTTNNNTNNNNNNPSNRTAAPATEFTEHRFTALLPCQHLLCISCVEDCLRDLRWAKPIRIVLRCSRRLRRGCLRAADRLFPSRWWKKNNDTASATDSGAVASVPTDGSTSGEPIGRTTTSTAANASSTAVVHLSSASASTTPPSQEELIAALEGVCPYCSRVVTDIFITDRLRQI